MSRQKAIICDLDGTLCDNSHRTSLVDGSEKKDWVAFNKQSEYDPVNVWCLELVNAMAAQGYKILFLTARSELGTTREITQNWLNRHVPGIDFELIMRSGTDFRVDYLCKMDLFHTKVTPFYDVLFAIDDKASISAMFRGQGITSLTCSDF